MGCKGKKDGGLEGDLAHVVEADQLVYDLGSGSAISRIFFFERGQQLVRHLHGDIDVPLLRQRLPRLLVMLRPGLLRARLLMLLRTRLLRPWLIAETGLSLPGAVTGRAAARLLRERMGHQVHAIVGRDGLRLSPAFPVSMWIRFARGIPVILTRIIFAKHQIEITLTDVRCFVKQYALLSGIDKVSDEI